MENKAHLQLIFVTESKNDYPYISSTIKALYDCSKDIRLDNAEMKGKNNYGDESVIKKINDLKWGFEGTSIVIYCYDTDDIFNRREDVEYEKKIVEYCNRNNYELVWFCRTIEEVFIGNTINEDKEKVMKRYIRNNEISSFIFDDCNTKHKRRTNLLAVVDKYCKRIN